MNEAQRLTGKKTWHAAREVLDGLVTKGILEHVSKYSRDPKAHYRLKTPSGT